MAVKLRLRREGTKKKPHYRVVAADSRSPRNGRFIEIIGEYHPMAEPSDIKIDSERALHWLRNGAKPTDAVENLLRIAGIWEEFKPGDAPKRDRSGKANAPKPSKKAKAKAEAAAQTGTKPSEPSEQTASEEASE